VERSEKKDSAVEIMGVLRRSQHTLVIRLILYSEYLQVDRQIIDLLGRISSFMG